MVTQLQFSFSTWKSSFWNEGVWYFSDINHFTDYANFMPFGMFSTLIIVNNKN